MPAFDISPWRCRPARKALTRRRARLSPEISRAAQNYEKLSAASRLHMVARRRARFHYCRFTAPPSRREACAASQRRRARSSRRRHYSCRRTIFHTLMISYDFDAEFRPSASLADEQNALPPVSLSDVGHFAAPTCAGWPLSRRGSQPWTRRRAAGHRKCDIYRDGASVSSAADAFLPR